MKNYWQKEGSINPFKPVKLGKVSVSTESKYGKRKITAYDLLQKFYNSEYGKNAMISMANKYPDHNFGEEQTEKATKYLMKEIKKKYPKDYKEVDEKDLYENIYDGLT